MYMYVHFCGKYLQIYLNIWGPNYSIISLGPVSVLLFSITILIVVTVVVAVIIIIIFIVIVIVIVILIVVVVVVDDDDGWLLFQHDLSGDSYSAFWLQREHFDRMLMLDWIDQLVAIWLVLA